MINMVDFALIVMCIKISPILHAAVASPTNSRSVDNKRSLRL